MSRPSPRRRRAGRRERLQVGIGKDGEASITLFMQAGGFELARSTFNATVWMRDKHGRIAAIAEVPGVWVE